MLKLRHEGSVYTLVWRGEGERGKKKTKVRQQNAHSFDGFAAAMIEAVSGGHLSLLLGFPNSSDLSECNMYIFILQCSLSFCLQYK